MKWLFESLPFIDPYPTWVKGLLSIWLVFSAICVATLLIAKPRTVIASDKSWLRVVGVSFNEPLPSVGVRVYAKVNGTTYTYPSVGGVQWVEPGPLMSSGMFEVPASSSYTLNFTMDTNKGSSYASQESIVLGKSDLPAPRSYRVYFVGGGLRSANPAAEISFIMSNSPN